MVYMTCPFIYLLYFYCQLLILEVFKKNNDNLEIKILAATFQGFSYGAMLD